jgi:hypothetical protein
MNYCPLHHIYYQELITRRGQDDGKTAFQICVIIAKSYSDDDEEEKRRESEEKEVEVNDTDKNNCSNSKSYSDKR